MSITEASNALVSKVNHCVIVENIEECLSSNCNTTLGQRGSCCWAFSVSPLCSVTHQYPPHDAESTEHFRPSFLWRQMQLLMGLPAQIEFVAFLPPSTPLPSFPYPFVLFSCYLIAGDAYCLQISNHFHTFVSPEGMECELPQRLHLEKMIADPERPRNTGQLNVHKWTTREKTEKIMWLVLLLLVLFYLFIFLVLLLF